ncbi:membrane protein [Planotetraspora kaengkrachanensis]|uniref:Membrane protein n=2 Tax=Planotetraspora kaengkrachanensis TaxID=575193 RepID=A0A8J3M085_9ACTN|nr:membrane protein [Planotetraspora kaengkrachanensis]
MLAPLGAGAAVAAAVTCLAVVDPNQPGHYPVCPLYFLTGLYCPGCGALRAVHDLAVGDLHGALGMNPLLVVAVPFAAYWWGRWALRSWQGRPGRMIVARPAPLWAVLVVVLAFGVVRNIPFGRFLAP